MSSDGFYGRQERIRMQNVLLVKSHITRRGSNGPRSQTGTWTGQPAGWSEPGDA